MNIRVRSIQFKLITTGLLSVLLPLLIVGYFSISNSSRALLSLSEDKALTMAGDLSRLVSHLLEAKKETSALLAGDQRVVAAMEELAGRESERRQESIRSLRETFTRQFRQLNAKGEFQGLFITDSNGQILTGILESGDEYPRLSIAENGEFRAARQSGQVAVSEMIRSQATSRLVVDVAAPVRAADGRFLGVVGMVLKADYFTNLIPSRKVGTTGYAYMINAQGLILAHPKTEFILNLNVTTIKEMEAINTQMVAGKNGVDTYVFKGVSKIAGFAPVGINGWSIAVTQNSDEFLAAADRIRTVLLVVLGTSLAIVACLLLFTTRAIIRPINAAVAGLKDIAQGEGDLTMRLAVSSRDEVGDLAQWFNLFIEKLQGIIRDVAAGVQTLSASATELSQIAEQMHKGAEQASQRSQTVATAAEEMSTNMNTVAAAMEQSTTNTQMVASASEEMSSTIGEIAEHAEKARGISSNAAKKAGEASTNINELGESAKSIGKVIETINEISEQVNLLALNATIEAARAGEAGKGFAVVANEIKELARQTAAATYDIKDKVGSIQGTTARTVEQISEINQVINDVNDVVNSIATAVEEQTAATSEIANNVNQMASGIGEVNENVSQSSTVAGDIAREITGVSQIAGEMFTGSTQVSDSAHELSSLAEQLNQMVGRFKTDK